MGLDNYDIGFLKQIIAEIKITNAVLLEAYNKFYCSECKTVKSLDEHCGEGLDWCCECYLKWKQACKESEKNHSP